MIKWRFGQAFIKRMSIGQMDGSKVGKCVDWELGGIGGQQGAQRPQNQG